MKLIDSYIIKRYLGTFFVMILLFIPIGIMVDLAEKIDKIKEKEVPLLAIFDYYIDFTWYFANLLFPIFLFLSVIWFTSRLANNTEVIAILSSGISFFRFLRPFLISATLIALFAFFAGMYIVPKSNQGFNDFRYKYLVKKEARNTDKVFLQINDDEFIYVNNYDPIRKQASDFTLEHFKKKFGCCAGIQKYTIYDFSTIYSTIKNFLATKKYIYLDAFNSTLTHLFVPNEIITSDEIYAKISGNYIDQVFHKFEFLNEHNRKLNTANQKYKDLTRALEKHKDWVSSANAKRLSASEIEKIIQFGINNNDL